MNSLKDDLKIEINLGEDVIAVTGEFNSVIEDADSYSALNVTFAADVRCVSFTRQDVLNFLYNNVALVAATYGPYSQDVADLEDDIAAVKVGAALADYAWMFETE